MGQTGSITQKAYVDPLLFPFTKWRKSEMQMLFLRSQNELPETFALRIAEFEFLLGSGTLVSGDIAVNMFNNMFDTDKNKIVDKFEVLAVICFVSGLTNTEKVEWLFDLFNFNSKGYLIQSDMSLLILSVACGICKADKNIKVPSARQQEIILAESFKFSMVNPGHSLRKPELVKFAATYKDVQLYLDAWRGHGGQVLLAGGEKWRDQFFMADELAIAPSRDWLKGGFPPPSFIRWRRLENVGTGGCHKLFSHTSSFAKTLEKRVLYYGRGLFANGLLIQGFLANRWVLNALAACLARPETMIESFSSTGQEDVGRYCVKVYENSGWRSVFIDSRVPCTHDCQALFTRSSDPLEYWPLLVEKALAKYFGSYAHIGMCSSRPDSSLFALRLLTGGHVLRHNVEDFAWKSSGLDVKEGQRDGFAFIDKAFEEGAIVALGRSQAQVMHKSTLGTAPRSAPPLGCLFPLVAISEDKEGWKHLTLRDAFGTIASHQDMNQLPDLGSGHCRTFRHKLDSIEASFDTIVIVRFPDSLRYLAEKLRIRQWNTEILSQYVSGQANVANFRLTVTEHTEPYKSAASASSELVGQAAMKAKEIEEKKKLASGGQSYDRFLKSVGKLIEPDKLVRSKGYVDFTMTISSGCDWIVAGNEKVEASTRVCLTPSEDTLLELQRRREVERRALRDERRKLAEQERKRKEILSALGDDQADKEQGQDGPLMSVAESKPSSAGSRSATTSGDKDREGEAPISAPSGDGGGSEEKPAAGSNESDEPKQEEKEVEKEEVEKEEGEDDDDDFYEYVLSPPGAAEAPSGGQYPVSSSSSSSGSNRPGVLKRQLKKGAFDVTFTSATCWHSQTLRLWPGEYFISACIDFNTTTEALAKAAKVVDVKDAPWLEHDNFAMEPKIWMQVSSNNGTFSISRSELYPSHGTSPASLEVQENSWPFLAESQGDVSTRSLVRMLSRLRGENELLGAQALSASKRFLDVYKREETRFFDGLEATRLRVAAEEEQREQQLAKERKRQEKEERERKREEEEEAKKIMEEL